MWRCQYSLAATWMWTYVDISWHKRLRRYTWLWGCALTEKTWGCRQTVEGTGSHMLRCHWNLYKPAETTKPQLGEGRGMPVRPPTDVHWVIHGEWGVIFSHMTLTESITPAFHFYVRSWHGDHTGIPCLFSKPNGRRIGAIDPQQWYNWWNTFP